MGQAGQPLDSIAPEPGAQYYYYAMRACAVSDQERRDHGGAARSH